MGTHFHQTMVGLPIDEARLVAKKRGYNIIIVKHNDQPVIPAKTIYVETKTCQAYGNSFQCPVIVKSEIKFPNNLVNMLVPDAELLASVMNKKLVLANEIEKIQPDELAVIIKHDRISAVFTNEPPIPLEDTFNFEDQQDFLQYRLIYNRLYSN